MKLGSSLTRLLKVSDGARTRDRRNHNPELYQLSYAHQVVTESSNAALDWEGGSLLAVAR